MFGYMKKIIVFCLVLAGVFGATCVRAQSLKLGIDGLTFSSDTVANETIYAHSVVSVKKKNMNGKGSTAIVVGGSRRSSIRTFELGWNVLDKEVPGDFFNVNNWKSTQVTINPFNLSATNRKGTFGLSMALGIRANNYSFNEAITMEKAGGIVKPVVLAGDVKKSKFTTAAIHIPMEVTIGKPYKLAFSVGGFADLNFNSHTKIKYKGGEKDKVRNFPVNFIQAGFTARISCRYLSLYCNWNPVGVFKDEMGPKMQVWSIGIGL